MKYLLVLGFALAFGAGLVIGLEQRIAAPAIATSQPSPRSRSFLTTELNLNAEQQEQIKKIWDFAHKSGREQEPARNQSKRDRDEQIAALIRVEDRERYNQILKSYSDGQDKLNRQSREAFANAVAKTKEILTPEQQKKYEEIMKSHRGPDRGSRQSHESGRRGDERATSRPGTDK